MDLKNINLKNLFSIFNTDSGVLNFCQQHNLIKTRKNCEVCNNVLKIHSSNKTIFPYKWRCTKSCKKEYSIRHNTFFENSKLTISEIIIFAYLWSQGMCSFKIIKKELGWHEGAFVDFKSFLREVCALKLMQSEEKIGGPDKIVEIDESLFVKRKNNVGRVTIQQWVFGGKERGSNKCFMVCVDRRDAATLLQVILDKMEPGTTIISDCWAAYNTIGDYEFQHLTVNHKFNFVDPVTSAHTQNIENMWGRAKKRNKIENGTKRELIDSYLQEFIWREKFGDFPFFNIINHISEFYNG